MNSGEQISSGMTGESHDDDGYTADEWDSLKDIPFRGHNEGIESESTTKTETGVENEAIAGAEAESRPKLPDLMDEGKIKARLTAGEDIQSIADSMLPCNIIDNYGLLTELGAKIDLRQDVLDKMSWNAIYREAENLLGCGISEDGLIKTIGAKMGLEENIASKDLEPLLDELIGANEVDDLAKQGFDIAKLANERILLEDGFERLLDYMPTVDVLSRLDNPHAITDYLEPLLKHNADINEVITKIEGYTINDKTMKTLLEYGVDSREIFEKFVKTNTLTLNYCLGLFLQSGIGVDEVIKKLGRLEGQENADILLRYGATKEQVLSFFDVDAKNAENLSNDGLIRFISKIKYSNAEEISGHTTEFMNNVLGSGQLDDETVNNKVDRIEDIFIHNNLPYVGKVFRTFRVLYPEGGNHDASKVMERGTLKGLPEDGIRSKNTVLFNDLLKASMGSNNRDLRKYLTDLIAGEELTKRVEAGKTEFTDKELTELGSYDKHLITIYNNTRAGREKPVKSSGDVLADLVNITKLIGPTSRYNIADRMVRSFGYGLGIKSCQEMLARMNEAVNNADARNREAAKNGTFRLESGDLIKSTSIEYLGGILQNGSVCKEFLNGVVSSDSTPLDTDLNILPAGLSGNISEGVDKKNSIAAFGAMHCMMVMKGDSNSGRQRFQMEGETEIYDPTKYEIWQNGGHDYGIRVGFPSTEIDYLIYDDLGGQNYDNLERIKNEVVKNGFYIPVVDKTTGNLVFSPEEYDARREKMRGLAEYGDERYRFADEEAWGGKRLVATMEVPGYTLPNGNILPSTNEIIAQANQNAAEIEKKRSAVLNQIIMPVLNEMGLKYKGQLDGDLTEGIAEAIDTGSTSRLTNIPGAGDFDYMLKVDRSIIENPEKIEELRNSFRERVGDQFLNGNVRAKNIQLEGLEQPVEVDVTFTQKKNKVKYSTDMALKSWYEAIEEISPERAQETRANVIYAKEFLKGIGAYKSFHAGEHPEGGLGGVGTENWILQNGGSFVAAARSFIDVANSCNSFDEFKTKYSVFDYGENHKNGEYDDFVTSNMDSAGYERMKTALGDFLKSLPSSI